MKCMAWYTILSLIAGSIVVWQGLISILEVWEQKTKDKDTQNDS